MSEAPITLYDPAAGWPDGDPQLLNDGLRPAPAFPLNTLGPIADFVRVLAAAKDGPPDYLAIALLTTAAGVVGAARSVRLRPNWIEPCVLWGLLVGNPSTGKSQPLDLLRRSARAIEAAEGADFAEIERAWKTEEAVAKAADEDWRAKVTEAAKVGRSAPDRPAAADASPMPEKPRVIIGNATVEKLGRLFAAHPRGLVLLIDEGAAWFGNFGKYGGDGDAAFYLSAFNGIGTTVDRVKEGGSVSSETAFLSACVGIQPERLSELLLKGRADDGLVSRFLPVWPDPVPPVWKAPYVDEGRVDTLLRQLRTLAPVNAEGRSTPRALPLTAEAEALFGEWWTDAKCRAQAASGLTAGFLGKGLGVVGRLALVLELLSWAWTGGAEPASVGAVNVARAIELFEGYFTPMAARVYGDASRPRAERAAIVLLKELRTRAARTFNARDVRRTWRLHGLTEAGEMDAALSVLAEADWTCAAGASGKEGGRPRSDYLVNPRLFEAAT